MSILQASKKISKKKSSPCIGMFQCMNALADKVYKNKTCHAHSDMHSITYMATLFNNHPYISSSPSASAFMG